MNGLGYADIGGFITIAFGLVLIGLGLIAIFRPRRALKLLSKMGSTWPINITELSLRALWGLGLYLWAPLSPYPQIFYWGGIFMMITSAIIVCLPLHWHNGYSRYWATRIPPGAVRYFGVISACAGAWLVHTVVTGPL